MNRRKGKILRVVQCLMSDDLRISRFISRILDGMPCLYESGFSIFIKNER